jgi:hypothetical protein
VVLCSWMCRYLVHQLSAWPPSPLLHLTATTFTTVQPHTGALHTLALCVILAKPGNILDMLHNTLKGPTHSLQNTLVYIGHIGPQHCRYTVQQHFSANTLSYISPSTHSAKFTAISEQSNTIKRPCCHHDTHMTRTQTNMHAHHLLLTASPHNQRFLDCFSLHNLSMT